MIDKGTLCGYTFNEKHKPGKDLNDAISEALIRHPKTIEVVVRYDESENMNQFDIPVSRIGKGIQPHHFILVFKTKIYRKPIIFGGDRCPIIKK